MSAGARGRAITVANDTDSRTPIVGDFLSVDLTATGPTSDLAVDGSSTPAIYSATPSAGEVWHIHRLTVVVVGDTTDVAVPAEFGNIAAPTTGLVVTVYDDEEDQVDATLIAANTNVSLALHATERSIDTASATKSAMYEIDFVKSTGAPVVVRDSLDQIVRAAVSDNLSTLGGLYVRAYGRRYPS